MFDKKTVDEVDVRGQNVLVRVDYNVPLENGKITSDLRIRASLPTIEYLRGHGARKIILMSHLGRPKGRDASLSLRPAAVRLKELIEQDLRTPVDVRFASGVTGQAIPQALSDMEEGGILVLENLRFFPGEKANDPSFMEEIIAATGAQLFVQDGFAVIHRAEASTSAVTKLLPSVAGKLVEQEVSTLNKVAKDPHHPLLVIIGGAKVEDKQPLIDKFLGVADRIAVGGKIAADGYKASDPKIYVAEDFATDANGAKLDIGPVSTEKIINMVKANMTIVWNGTMGLTEQPPFDTASTRIAEAIGHKLDPQAGENLDFGMATTTVICGGDTSGFVEGLEAKDDTLRYSLVSTGGGASLALLCGDPLSGLEGLQNRY